MKNIRLLLFCVIVMVTACEKEIEQDGTFTQA